MFFSLNNVFASIIILVTFFSPIIGLSSALFNSSHTKTNGRDLEEIKDKEYIIDGRIAISITMCFISFIYFSKSHGLKEFDLYFNITISVVLLINVIFQSYLFPKY